eukprot:CAMPEP_0194192652 /NCGR_PEP_ID=MMETSP0154-20130528/71517_1 /TAXON_ID=1049557 /ORGANISM="Thalassiothrix antarctica, Strain L6-D1" /LENGTH=218 /DNA_ID=CAMNT_0038916269 /DNA_START=40 /DNA_END=693 /DNA_ORIENTATION=+
MIDEIIATTAVLPEEKQAKTMQILYRNPSLLARTNNEFKKKLESAQRRITNSNSTLTLETALLPPKTKRSSKTATAVGEAVNSISNKTIYEDLNSERVEISKLTTTATPKPDNATTVNATTRRTDSGVLGSFLEDITSSMYKLEQEYDDDVIPIIVYAAGSIYPPDSLQRPRGTQQAGGVSLFFPQVAYGSARFQDRFEQISKSSFPQIGLIPEEKKP